MLVGSITVVGITTLDSGLRRNDGFEGGMTLGGWIPACAGMTVLRAV